MICSLDSDVALADGGGKAASLARLARAGFPVPHGFVVTTEAYRRFLDHNALGAWVSRAASGVTATDSGTLDSVAASIQARFAAGVVPTALSDAIHGAYADMGAPPVAVRSSATTEDLPELSFAGQHESFLNVIGHDALLRDIKRCWASLWTPRAIGYRIRNGVAHEDAELAVIVQVMVQSDAAGVLFTANPLNGRRSETTIDATLGLGEALVAGLVEPDHYVVDSETRRIVRKRLGAKGVAVRSASGGGTISVEESSAEAQAISDETIVALTELGARVALALGAPQDIEWAVAGDAIALLQSRPITSLFPLPAGMTAAPLRVMLSLGAIQGMLDPLTPLGRDIFRHGAAVAASAAGTQRTTDTQRAFIVAGDRLFVDVTIAARDIRLRRVLRSALALVGPGIGRALDEVLDDPRLTPDRVRPRIRTIVFLIPFLARALGNATYALLWPDAARARIHRRIERAIARVSAHGASARTLRARIALCDAALHCVADFGPVLTPGLAVGLGSLAALHRIVADVPDGATRLLDVTRGLAHNVTTEMDLALWGASQRIRANREAAASFATHDAAQLARDAASGRLPAAGQEVVDAFLARFGSRGVAEIDIGRVRWSEDSTLLMQSLQSYLAIQDVARSPDAVFTRGAGAAAAAIESLVASARAGTRGAMRAALVRAAAHRVRALAGLRESPKFSAVRLNGMLRQAFLASGRELAASGVLAHASDVFFLSLDQLRRLDRGEQEHWREIVSRERASYEREKRRRQVPGLLLSDGHAFHAGANAVSSSDGEIMVGTPVSAGVVEGLVRIIFDPHADRLAPGEILVCPGTDPAWTPLFLVAGGLVLEVGGLMTHGSVVAREYGIPAVVGVHAATTRLRTGQRIRVDGTSGAITVLSA
jgi:rifampicin phosphotransferase